MSEAIPPLLQYAFRDNFAFTFNLSDDSGGHKKRGQVEFEPEA
jgi:hypothetical protein